MVLSNSNEPIATLIVLSMALLAALILLFVAVHSKRRERIYKRKADELESLYKEAQHYDEQIKEAYQRMK